MTDLKECLIFSTEAYAYLADRLCEQEHFERGVIERLRFSDGELYQRIVSSCSGGDIVLVGGTISEADTLELYDLACALVSYGASRLTIVIPYFGYSTMERSVQAGEVVTAKTRARLLSSIPVAAMGNRVILFDLHTAGIAHYFEGAIRPVHVYAKSIVAEAVRTLGGDSFVLGCTDAGRAKWVESLAHDLAVDVGFVYKRRIADGNTEVVGVSAHVTGKDVVIYDDMIRSGSSLLGAATAYLEAGATRVTAVTTHGLFPGDALQRIQDSSLVDSIVCTDTHPRAVELAGDYLEVQSIAQLLSERLRGLS